MTPDICSRVLVQLCQGPNEEDNAAREKEDAGVYLSTCDKAFTLFLYQLQYLRIKKLYVSKSFDIKFLKF